MSRPRDTQILAYLGDLAVAVGLPTWTFEMDASPPTNRPPDTVWATITINDESAQAILWVADDLFTRTPAQQRVTLVHELVHCHLEPLSWSFNQAAETGLPATALNIATHTFGQRVERATDDLARLLAPHCPLPPWTKKG